MSPAIALIVGAFLCFFGSVSVRVVILAAGFGTGWLLAEVFDADWATTLLVALGAAAIAFVLSSLLARFVLFIEGAIVGSLIGAKVFVLADGGESDWLLAVVVVPAVGLLCGFLASLWKRRFMRWATAFAGAGLMLSAVGRFDTDSTDLLWRPETTARAALFTVFWLALGIFGHSVQKQGIHRRQPGATTAG